MDPENQIPLMLTLLSPGVTDTSADVLLDVITDDTDAAVTDDFDTTVVT